MPALTIFGYLEDAGKIQSILSQPRFQAVARQPSCLCINELKQTG